MATAIGLFFANVFKRFYSVLSTGGLSYEEPETAKPMDVVVGIFPSNFLAPVTESNMLQVIVMALLIGFAIILLGEKAAKTIEGIALVAGVDRIFDMGRTTFNITGDAFCAIIISNMMKKNARDL